MGRSREPSCPPDVLEVLVDDSDSQVRDTAVRNPNLGVEVLERLAAHRDKYTRHAVIENPSVPDRLLERLREDECVLVFSAAAYTLRERRARNAASEGAEPLVAVA